MAKVRVEVFKGYPFLAEISVEEEIAYLRKFVQDKDSIAVLVFDEAKIVGVSIGAPFENQEEAFLKLFRSKNLKPSNYFYFGQSVVLEAYRGRGLNHHFFDIREKHVKHLKRFKSICFTSIVRPSTHPLAPSDYSSLANFWEKNGYVKQSDIICYKSWKDREETKQSPKQLMFWIKNLAI